ncbi:unnamed protein product [Rotaria magnacalcarata]|uniref:WSC domain-containing protein n=3 Tax=Rotaria magnacalcarata TaxID=392030 RepID=A0A8S2LI12_9BILA|nr:unnamed protein product [Rotaria magnacalcarata]
MQIKLYERYRVARCSGPKWGALISKWGTSRVQLSGKWGTFVRVKFLRTLYNERFQLPSFQSDQSHLLEQILPSELRNNQYRYNKKIPNVISTKLNYSEVDFRLLSSPPILWLDMHGDPHWNEAAEREMYGYLLEKQTIRDSRSNDKIIDECLDRPLFIINQQGWVSNAGRDDFLNEGILRYFDPISTCSKFTRHSRLEPIRKCLHGATQNSMSTPVLSGLSVEHIPHRRVLFYYNRGSLDYNFSFAYLINHTYEHMYHEPSLSSVYLNKWKSRNRSWGQSTINLPCKSYQLTHILADHWSNYLNDKNGQSLNDLVGLFIRRGDKEREDSFWINHRRWRNIFMYVKGIVDEEQRRNQIVSSIFAMTDDVSVMKSLQDYANTQSKGIDEPYARQYLRRRQIMYNVFAPQLCFDPFIRIGFDQFLVSFEFLVQYAKFIVDQSDSNVGRYLEESIYARHQLNVSVRTNSFVRDAPDFLQLLSLLMIISTPDVVSGAYRYVGCYQQVFYDSYFTSSYMEPNLCFRLCETPLIFIQDTVCRCSGSGLMHYDRHRDRYCSTPCRQPGNPQVKTTEKCGGTEMYSLYAEENFYTRHAHLLDYRIQYSSCQFWNRSDYYDTFKVNIDGSSTKSPLNRLETCAAACLDQNSTTTSIGKNVAQCFQINAADIGNETR